MPGFFGAITFSGSGFCGGVGGFDAVSCNSKSPFFFGYVFPYIYIITQNTPCNKHVDEKVIPCGNCGLPRRASPSSQ